MKKILFFDDEPFLTKMLIDNLQKNYNWNKDKYGEITNVSTANELFDKIKDESIKYDLIILDIMVPMDQVLTDQIKNNHLFSEEEINRMQEGDNTGVVFAEKLRSMSNYKDIPILFLSARIRPSEIIDNNTYYLEKPIFAKDVSEKMKQMLNINME